MKSFKQILLGFSALLLLSSLVYTFPHQSYAEGRWEILNQMVMGHGNTASAVLTNGSILVTSGVSGPAPYHQTEISELFNPLTGLWTITGNVNQARDAFRDPIVLSNNKVLIAGGVNSGGNVDYSSAELYDPETGSWELTDNLNTPRRYAVIVGLKDGKALITTGRTGSSFLSSSEIYDPSTENWVLTGQTNIARESAKGVLLNDGNILLLGGYNNSGFIKSTEKYNPSLGIWTTSGDLYAGRLGSAIALLADGRVLVAGGVNNTGYLTETEIYDPSSNSWTQVGSMHYPRASADAVLLDDGRILIAGGDINGTAVLPSEIFDPISNTWSIDAFLQAGHSGGKLIKLQNRDIVMIGGWDGAPQTLVELYSSGEAGLGLQVPLFKQTDLAWGSDIYDSATSWSPSNPTVSAWGCAMTSAAMVFNYHKIIKLPDNTNLTPGTLNTWLKNQPDGYIRNGFVNWIALSRLSKQAKESGYNPNFTFDALEYRKTNTFDNHQLKNDLQNNQPDILEEPGHFIVAKGEQDETFTINDPYYSYSTLEEGYNNSALSLRRFIPSHTDLSYVYVIADLGLSLTLKDSDNNSLGDTFIQNPLHSPIDNSYSSDESVIELLAPTPETGLYQLIVTSSFPKSYSLDIFLYDMNGDVKKSTVSGFTSESNIETYLLSYDHDNYTLTKTHKEVTFQSFIQDINEAIELDKINKGIGESLIAHVNSAQRSSDKNQPLNAIKHLMGANGLLQKDNDKLIDSDAHQILADDLSTLLNSF